MQSLIERDLTHIWHPCSQMKDYETFPPLVIKKADGSYIELEDGRKIIDVISSWWCKPLGHAHPRLKAALQEQLNDYEHVIAANTCQKPLVELSEKLISLIPHLSKVFYACDGSTAVEIAIKMSLHTRLLQGQPQRKRFLALQNGYHGETVMALSLSDVGLYKDPYQTILQPVSFLQGIPYVNFKEDPLWSDCSHYWPAIEAQLLLKLDTLCAIIVEPILQGSGSMKIYSADFLKRLYRFTQQHGVHLIADEILTGCGRTGFPLACQLAGIEADFVCLGKGLAGGMLPISAVLCRQDIYNLFYDDYETRKSFLHSNTFCGNALAARVALECLCVLEEENIYAKVQSQEHVFRHCMQDIANKTQRLQNIRNIGGMVAADLILDPSEAHKRWGYKIYQEAVKLGALLRPLGNTIYWFPPLNMKMETLMELKEITQIAIERVL